MEVKIEIPDNCELVKEGDSYIVREKVSKPKSWNEFCNKFPVKSGECYINTDCDIMDTLDWTDFKRRSTDANLCVSREEAEAFLALMQLRQLRKAWIGDWNSYKGYAIIAASITGNPFVAEYSGQSRVLSFPDKKTAITFLDCFWDLCQTAEMLL